MFEAVILAGGFGTRLKEISGDIPKPMVPVNGKPFLYYIFDKLESSRCTKILLSIHYRSDYIIEKIKKDMPTKIPIEFIIEKKPLGTGGALRLASNRIINSRFLALNGDTFTDVNFEAIYKLGKKSEIVLSAVEVPDVSRYGLLKINKSGVVTSIGEKNNTGKGYINGGVYSISKSVFHSVDEDSFSLEKDILPNYVNKMLSLKVPGYFVDIGIPKDFYLFEQHTR